MLTLSTLHCPPGLSPQRREVLGNTISLGRGVECDWVLPDPDRILSKLHCLLSRAGTFWTVTDVSSNGTQLDGLLLEPGVPQPLRHGSRLQLGRYEIEAALDVPEAATPGAPAPPDPALREAIPSNLTGIGDEDPAGMDATILGRTTLLRPTPRSGGPAEALTGRPAREPADAAVLHAFSAGLQQDVPEGADPAKLMFEMARVLRIVVDDLRDMLSAQVRSHQGLGLPVPGGRLTPNLLELAGDGGEALRAVVEALVHDTVKARDLLHNTMRDLADANAATTRMARASAEALLMMQPARILRELPASAADALPGRRKQRAWDRFEAAHRALAGGAETDGETRG